MVSWNREYRERREAEGRPVLAGGRWIKPHQRVAIYERDGGVCQLCSEPVDFDAHVMSADAPTLDHVLPRSLGGGDEPENLRLACRACNVTRGNRLDWTVDHVASGRNRV